jgi:hypothetical protein
MYPTLTAPGFLEVRPYGSEKPCRGDVVYFRSPAKGIMVVHRVMAVTPEGLVTCGDNNPQNDDYIVPLSALKGKVVALTDENRRRTVRGGWAGMLDYAYVRLLRKARVLAGQIYHVLFPPGFITGSLRFFAPQKSRFKFVYFGYGFSGQMKIMTGNKCVGHYDRRGVWYIDYPSKLWIDPARVKSAARLVEEQKKRHREELMRRRIA